MHWLPCSLLATAGCFDSYNFLQIYSTSICLRTLTDSLYCCLRCLQCTHVQKGKAIIIASGLSSCLRPLPSCSFENGADFILAFSSRLHIILYWNLVMSRQDIVVNLFSILLSTLTSKVISGLSDNGIQKSQSVTVFPLVYHRDLCLLHFSFQFIPPGSSDCYADDTLLCHIVIREFINYWLSPSVSLTD